MNDHADRSGIHDSADSGQGVENQHQPPLRTYMFRMLAVLGLGSFFVLTASVIVPQSSRASLQNGQSPPSSYSTPRGAILGRLHGATQEVVIRSGADGPSYDLYSLDGRMIARQLTYTELSDRLAQEHSDIVVPDGTHSNTRIGIVDESVNDPQPHR